MVDNPHETESKRTPFWTRSIHLPAKSLWLVPLLLGFFVLHSGLLESPPPTIRNPYKFVLLRKWGNCCRNEIRKTAERSGSPGESAFEDGVRGLLETDLDYFRYGAAFCVHVFFRPKPDAWLENGKSSTNLVIVALDEDPGTGFVKYSDGVLFCSPDAIPADLDLGRLEEWGAKVLFPDPAWGCYGILPP